MSLTKEAKLAYSTRNRQRKLSFALKYALEHDVQTVLLVGVSGRGSGIENTIERGLQDSWLDVTATGLDPIGNDWDDYLMADALNLPFPDKLFDLVYSNAVIEHVGGEDEQLQFVAEHARVGKHWVFTTPNRYCPLEAHTNTLFKHWSKGWTSPKVTRLLGPADLQRIIPQRSQVHGGYLSPTLTVTSS